MAGRSPARFLAPLALVGFALALFLVLSSGLGDEGGPSPRNTVERPDGNGSSPNHRSSRKRTRKKTYVVKEGDTPSSIAEKTGVDLAKIVRLNPDIDPQTLSPGDRLRLRR